jgi:hypothetical protein
MRSKEEGNSETQLICHKILRCAQNDREGKFAQNDKKGKFARNDKKLPICPARQKTGTFHLSLLTFHLS